MIRRQMTLQPVSLLVIAVVLLLLLTAVAVERQASVQGLQPAHWNATGTTHAVVAAPAAEPAQTSSPVTRSISAAPGGAPVAPAAPAQTISDQPSNPAAASQCPTKPGSDLACSAP